MQATAPKSRAGGSCDEHGDDRNREGGQWLQGIVGVIVAESSSSDTLVMAGHGARQGG